MVRKETKASEAIPKNFPITKAIGSTLGKSKMQWVFFMIFLLICPFLALFLREFNNIYQMRKSQRPDYNWPKYSDLWLAFITSVLLTGLLLIFQKVFTRVGMKIISERYKGKEREARAERMIKSLFKGIYFTFVVGFGYYIAKDSYFFPSSLGGHGDLETVMNDLPFFNLEGIFYLKEYFMIQLGYHFHSLIVHICSPIRNDFMEMLLHHTMTVMLVSLSYLMNYLPMSLLILFSHDVSDAFVCYSRFFVDTDYTNCSLGSYIGLMTTWVYTRLIIFPFDLIRMSCYTNPMIHEMHGIGILGAMIHALAVLHFYWFILLIKMGLKYAKSSVTVDLQQDLSRG